MNNNIKSVVIGIFVVLFIFGLKGCLFGKGFIYGILVQLKAVLNLIYLGIGYVLLIGAFLGLIWVISLFTNNKDNSDSNKRLEAQKEQDDLDKIVEEYNRLNNFNSDKDNGSLDLS